MCAKWLTCNLDVPEVPTCVATGLLRCEMDEFSVPPKYLPSPQENLTDDVFAHAEQTPEHVGFSRQVDGRWVPVTYQEVAEQVTRLAAGLIASGVQAGERVVLFSGTRFEWMLCDFAIWAAGGVTVPVYETSSAEHLRRAQPRDPSASAG